MNYESIKFINFDDFYQNRKLLRHYYQELSLGDKIKYKRFVYDELKECMSDKDVIWNFLNENENCKKELAARVNTRRHSRKHKKEKNLFDILEELEARKKIDIKRLDIFGLTED